MTTRTNPDGTYNWANEHDWGTPEQQQAELDAPDERKVSTLTRWAVIGADAPRATGADWCPYASRADADAVSRRVGRVIGEPCRVVRLDITISEAGAAPARDGGAR